MTTAIAEAEVLGVRTLMKNPPTQVLAEASEAAKALKTVLDQKPNKVMMGGEQYLEFEDWQTLGRFYSVTAKEDGDPEYVNLGGIEGFKASSVAVDPNGNEISRATAYCMRDEEKWGARNKYAWAYVLNDGSGTSVDDPGSHLITWIDNPSKPGKKMPMKEKVLVGEEKVPLYQLASMAQTRANAKALRNVLSWVVVLAGYKATPAEELPSRDDEQDEKPKPKPKPADNNQPPPKKDDQPKQAPAPETNLVNHNELQVLDELLQKTKSKVDPILTHFKLAKIEDLSKQQWSQTVGQLRRRLEGMEAEAKIKADQERAAKEIEDAKIRAAQDAAKAAPAAAPPPSAPMSQGDIPW